MKIVWPCESPEKIRGPPGVPAAHFDNHCSGCSKVLFSPETIICSWGSQWLSSYLVNLILELTQCILKTFVCLYLGDAFFGLFIKNLMPHWFLLPSNTFLSTLYLAVFKKPSLLFYICEYYATLPELGCCRSQNMPCSVPLWVSVSWSSDFFLDRFWLPISAWWDLFHFSRTN